MNTKFVVFVVVAMTAVGPGMTGSASATLITDIQNPSFEAQVLPNDKDDTAGSGVTGWSQAGGGGYWIGAQNPSGDQFTDAAGNGTPKGASGVNTLDIFLGSNEWGTVSQTLSEKLQLGTYTLTVAVGREYRENNDVLAGAADFNFGLSTTDGVLLAGSEKTWHNAAGLGLHGHERQRYGHRRQCLQRLHRKRVKDHTRRGQ